MSEERSPASLPRQLGLLSATMIVVGGIIGGGIFTTPAEVARQLGSGAWILAVWGVGGLVGLAGALTFAELGAMMPDAGGVYVYVREAYGELPAFLYGWMQLTCIATASDAAVAVFFAGYVGRFVALTPIGGPLVLAGAVIVALTVTNLLGVRPGAWVQNTLTLAKTVVLLALIVLGLVGWSGPAMGAVGGAVVAAPGTTPTLLAGLAGAFVPVLFSIGGWENLNMVAGEVRDPTRLVPRALGIGLAIVIVVYVGANAVYLHVLGRDGLATSAAVAADTAARLAGRWGAIVIAIAAMTSILGLVNVVLLATPRIFYAMATDRIFFSFAARIHPRFGTPYWSILLMGAWALGLLVVTHGRIGELLGGVVFADWIFFGLGAASVVVLRQRRPDLDRPYRTWGYPVVPTFFVVAAIIAVVSAITSAPAASLRGAVLLGLGIPLFYGLVQWQARSGR